MTAVVADLRPTRRQLDILALHAQGMTFEEIGERVYLSQYTVRWHLNCLRKRIQAQSLSHAVVLCIARGYLCVDGRTDRPFVPDEFEVVAA